MAACFIPQIRNDMTYEEGLAVSTLWQEARGAGHSGQLCVAHVIRNRMTKDYSSNGQVYGTVLVPWQFSGWMTDAICLESLRYAATDSDNLLAVWKESAFVADPTHGALLYYSPDAMAPRGSVPDWVSKCRLTLDLTDFLFYTVD